MLIKFFLPSAPGGPENFHIRSKLCIPVYSRGCGLKCLHPNWNQKKKKKRPDSVAALKIFVTYSIESFNLENNTIVRGTHMSAESGHVQAYGFLK